jgi:uncharacterized protein (DUF486 family)
LAASQGGDGVREFSLYEQVGILIPGSVFLVGTYMIVSPDTIKPTEVDLGGFGLLVVIGYGAGHLMAAIGNWLERLIWWPQGGMPSNWPIKEDPSIISTDQVAKLQTQMKSRLGIEITIVGADRARWGHCFQQAYADVRANRLGLVEVHNTNYGMSRGLAAAMLAILVVYLTQTPAAIDWGIAALITAIALAFIIRMCRFGKYFAREVLLNFLNLPATKAP